MSSESEWNDGDEGIATDAAKPKLKPPRRYKVLLLNDDFTPMEFVVHILEDFFSMDRARATRVMLTVHTQGKGIAGIFSREIAESKVEQVNAHARKHQHPLLCTMEAE